FVAGGEDIVVGCGQLAPADPAGEGGAVLDDERICRDVVHARREYGVDAGVQVAVAFAGRAVDQIQVDVLEPGSARLLRGRDRPAGRVGAVEDGQHVLGRGLHTEGDAGVPGRADPLEERGRGRLGVGFGGDLGV